MTKLTKRVVEAAQTKSADYFIWDDELPGYGLRVFASGRRSYLIQYRAKGRTRRYTIGLHGPWTAEMARKEAMSQLGCVARGEDPAEDRLRNHKAMTVKQLGQRYIEDMEKGLVLGRSGRPKTPKTVDADIGRINRHIIPLLGTRKVQDITNADVVRMMKSIMAGETRTNVKTEKLRGRAIVTGGAGTASRAVGLLGGMFTYAKEDLGIELPCNPAHGIKRPKDNVRRRRLSHKEYRAFGRIIAEYERHPDFCKTARIARLLALTGCRRGEIITLQRHDPDPEHSCVLLRNTKTGDSIRPLGLPALELMEQLVEESDSEWLFSGARRDGVFGGFPHQWNRMLAGTELEGVTPHVLRHSFASLANDLGFTEVTIAAMLGHAHKSITSRYIHSTDTVLVMAADAVSGMIDALLDDRKIAHTSYALDRDSRRAAMDRLLCPVNNNEAPEAQLAA